MSVVELQPRSRQAAYTWLAVVLLGAAIGVLAVAQAAGAEHERELRERGRRRGETLSALDEQLDAERAENQRLREQLAAHEHSEQLGGDGGA